MFSSTIRKTRLIARAVPGSSIRKTQHALIGTTKRQRIKVYVPLTPALSKGEGGELPIVPFCFGEGLGIRFTVCSKVNSRNRIERNAGVPCPAQALRGDPGRKKRSAKGIDKAKAK